MISWVVLKLFSLNILNCRNVKNNVGGEKCLVELFIVQLGTHLSVNLLDLRVIAVQVTLKR